MFDKNYLSPSGALELILDSLPDGCLPAEKLHIEDCYGRISASDIHSPENLPSFDRSTVDGYALNSGDTFGARETAPAYINVVREIPMGGQVDFKLGGHEAAGISTGGMLPGGADAVLMLEHAQPVSGDMIEALRAVSPGENVIPRGDDIKEGELILSKGRRLRPQDIGALAGVGITEIDVIRRPLISIISTGDEIVPARSLLKPGQVRDINSFTLAGLVIEHGGVPVKKGIFRDNYDSIRDAVRESVRDSDMVLISGGTSAGMKDMTADVINSIGKPGVLFHGVSLKPGKPMTGGVVEGKTVLGLPGHPVAVAVCFELFIRPVIERLCGCVPQGKTVPTVAARMSRNIASAAGREDHIRVYLEERDGELFAAPVLGKSGLISSLVRADGTVVIPPERLGLDAGETVAVRLF